MTPCAVCPIVTLTHPGAPELGSKIPCESTMRISQRRVMGEPEENHGTPTELPARVQWTVPASAGETCAFCHK